MTYGVPYQGSKNKLAKWIVDLLPEAENFYDLFAGGCAVSHRAIETGKYKKIFINDLGLGPALFINACRGKYLTERKWISRDMFYKYKDVDPYIKYCWSFSNNGCDYLYGRSREEKEHNIWEYHIIHPDCKGKRCDNIGRINRINKLAGLNIDNVEISYVDYKNVPIKANSVLYCDIPYKGTNTRVYRTGKFDYSSFYDWCKKQNQLVAVSEKEMPMTDFVCIGKCPHKYTNNKSNNAYCVTEKLFIPKHQVSLYESLMG